MNKDLHDRLRRLGVVKGARTLKPAPPRPQEEVVQTFGEPEADDESAEYEILPLERLLPGGRLVETEMGACFVLDKVYPADYRHGDDRLSDLLSLSLETAALFANDARLAELDFRDFLFLDTETTGLMGAGTLAFMVGIAFWEGDAFVVRQYFLRDHGDEPAMLFLLAQLLEERPGLITFNGRTFDLPLLDNRYLMNRLDDLEADLLERPHIDLLPPARRLWRRRLGSCALGALEETLLGVHRTEEDVPGWLIPGLYMDYLRTGDARQLVRVFYHNRLDMLSMVTLAARILRHFGRPQHSDHSLDLVSLARWQQALGMTADAEAILRMAAEGESPLEIYHQILADLGALLKREGRRPEAVMYWQQIAVTTFDTVEAHVELAKYYEWEQQDLGTALSWTQQALTLVQSWSARDAGLVEEELLHRLARLERKLSSDFFA
ncbi:MAG: ribonuclease H-like domain-containing protein [Candidatus Promineifilaceae bacterium]